MVPARAIEAWRAKNAAFVGDKNDAAWHALETRRFILSTELSKDERLCYENEYGITERDYLEIEERVALMSYVITGTRRTALLAS